MAGIASRLLNKAMQSIERMGTEYIPANLASNQVVTLAGTVGAAAGIGGPVAGAVVGLTQLVTANFGEYFRLRAMETQMKAHMRLREAQMKAHMSLSRDRLIFGFVEKVGYLVITLLLAVLFRKALMAQLKKLNIPELARIIRSRWCQSCAERNEQDKKKSRDGNGNRNGKTNGREIDPAAESEYWTKCE